MKKDFKKLLVCGLVVATFTIPKMAAFAGSYSYSGTVYKYADYESSSQVKENSTENAINDVSVKPSGSFVSWIEVSSLGQNATYKTTYTTTGKYSMNYVKNIDDNDSCAANLYRNKTQLNLNISTTLTNFTSGSVSGNWSPDNY